MAGPKVGDIAPSIELSPCLNVVERIDFGGTPRSHPARNPRHTCEQRDHADVSDGIKS
jgi:hypothetical protein